ncbi:MAG: glycosyltransferase family 39 protein [bacterium]|nr:glycosyltransferase family 39 protein [bacterium]
MTSTTTPQPATRGDLAFLGFFAAIKLLLHLPILGRFGYHHDELYFLACGHHLSFGYVDHAPLVPWIARLADELFGQSLYGLRIFATLAGVAAVFLTGLLTRRLGGGRFAQAVACLSMLIAPVYLRTGNMLTIPSFEVLFWIIGSYLLVRILQEEDPRLWLWVGLVAGVGLMNKHSMLFFGVGLTAALLLTPERRYFKSPWLYLGGAVALVVFSPNLIWQMSNGWPTAEFLADLNQGTMSGISALQFVAGQLLYLNPFAAPVWIAGLWYFFSQPGKRYRVLGWIWVTVFILLIVIKSKIYYLAPAYPALLAGGGLAFERLVERGRAWLRPAAISGLAAGGLIFLPVSLPILSIDAIERYVTTITFGAFENVYELTGDLRGMFGWPERVAAVAEVYDRLPPEERERAVILTSSYGKAGAVDYFGEAYGLPKAVSFHMTYHLWGLPEGPIDTVIALGIPADQLEKLYEEVTVEARLELDNVNPWDRELEVAVCRRPKVDLHEIWAKNRRW